VDTARRLEAMIEGISHRSLAAIQAFAQGADTSRAWLDDVDRALAFAAELESIAGVGSEALDAEREAEICALLPRGDLVVSALDSILRVAQKDMLYAMTDAIDWFGTLGVDKLETLRVHAEWAHGQLASVHRELETRGPLFERHLADGHVAGYRVAVAGLESACIRFDTFARGWLLASAFDRAIGESHDAWSAALGLRTIGSAGALQMEAALDCANPFRVGYERIASVVSIGEAVADLGLTRKELVEMRALLGAARAVQAQFSPLIAYYDEHLAEIRATVGFFSFLARTSERFAAVVEDAERKIQAAALR
jgi:hypothetical protein